MSEYAKRSAENKIDVSVLRHLTDQTSRISGLRSGIDEMLAAINEVAAATATEPGR